MLKLIVAFVYVTAASGLGISTPELSGDQTCRYLPGDAGWPNTTVWDNLNQTVAQRLIRGIPLGQPCYQPDLDMETCSQIKENWLDMSPYLADPVNVMSPYWMNNSCSPFIGPNGNCSLGNIAVYSLNVSGAEDVKAGILFAQDSNIRLTIKNTGHDFLGRSAGKGSLELWMHNLQEITFLNYSSSLYSGPAVRVGAGVEYQTVLSAASAQGLRVVGGSCPTVGMAGGFSQGGGHGPLGAAYGLGADQVLEWEVVTAAGKHMTVTPTSNADLFWALSGGGSGNFAVVLSMTARAHRDGPVAGAGFTFANNGNDTAYWTAITAWIGRMLDFDAIEGLTTVWAFTLGGGTYMNEATWDNENWKEDYFGSNYEALTDLKLKFEVRPRPCVLG